MSSTSLVRVASSVLIYYNAHHDHEYVVATFEHSRQSSATR